jgi:hypothetical protein
VDNKPVGNGWAKWSVYVLKELERQNGEMKAQAEAIAELKNSGARQDEREKAASLLKLPDRVDALETEMTRMQVKAGIWGAIGAAIPIIASYLLTR